jgi:hypothetical protein
MRADELHAVLGHDEVPLEGVVAGECRWAEGEPAVAGLADQVALDLGCFRLGSTERRWADVYPQPVRPARARETSRADHANDTEAGR